MRRREFMALAGAVAALPFAAFAQNTIPMIGVLALGSPDPEVFMRELRQGLQDLGYSDGKNIRLMLLSAHGRAEDLPRLAADLVRLKADIIVTFQTPALVAASRTTANIPIVIGTGDPAATGRVENIARPGGNVTGVVQGILETTPKVVELIREMLPRTSRIAVLANATDPFTRPFLAQVEIGGHAAGMSIEPIVADPGKPFDPAFEEMRRRRVDVLIVQPSLLIKDAVELALRNRLPTFSSNRLLPVLGGLASYAGKISDVYRNTATYVDRILKGSKPADLPIAFPTKFELVINLKTANALGISVSPALLARADEVIE